MPCFACAHPSCLRCYHRKDVDELPVSVVDLRIAGRPVCSLQEKFLTPLVPCRAVRDLSPPGELLQQASLPFEFKNVEMEYDSYRGQQVRLRCIPDQWLLCTQWRLAISMR